MATASSLPGFPLPRMALFSRQHCSSEDNVQVGRQPARFRADLGSTIGVVKKERAVKSTFFNSQKGFGSFPTVGAADVFVHIPRG
jgi:hypothetical protein